MLFCAITVRSNAAWAAVEVDVDEELMRLPHAIDTLKCWYRRPCHSWAPALNLPVVAAWTYTILHVMEAGVGELGPATYCALLTTSLTVCLPWKPSQSLVLLPGPNTHSARWSTGHLIVYTSESSNKKYNQTSPIKWSLDNDLRYG